MDTQRDIATLSRGRAGPAWPEGRPGPTPKGPGSGQNFGHVARPPWGQGPKHLTWPDLARPGVDPARPCIKGVHCQISQG